MISLSSSEISAQIYSPITPDASFEFDDDDEEINISEAIDLTPTQSTKSSKYVLCKQDTR